MSKFTTKTTRAEPGIATSSLPDIVFMLLFFFMVVTVFRDHQVLLKINLPAVSQSQKLKHQSAVQRIYIGLPQYEQENPGPVIQINDAFVRLDEIQTAVPQLKAMLTEPQQAHFTTSLRVDKAVEMGIVSDVKIELRKAEQYQLNYAAITEGEQ